MQRLIVCIMNCELYTCLIFSLINLKIHICMFYKLIDTFFYGMFNMYKSAYMKYTGTYPLKNNSIIINKYYIIQTVILYMFNLGNKESLHKIYFI